jgi:predicted hotdog family 3-hydroxylacyl-ACP dehydratase
MNLPADTEQFMLHRAPMRLVHRLLCVEGDRAEAESKPEAGDAVIGPDGKVERTALLEMVAQTYAAARGYRDLSENKPPALGYLVGASDFRIERAPQAGQLLRIEVQSANSFEDFYLVDGRVLCQNQVLAEGTLKVWLQIETGPQTA